MSAPTAWSRLRARPDFRRAPLTALWRRVWWRLRWRMRQDLWDLPLGDDLTIAVPRQGPAALIYYQRYSEPATAEFVQRFLKRGDAFVDVGAFVGEYTLLADRAVGATGELHAFEPNPSLYDVLLGNAARCRCRRVTTNAMAVGDADDTRAFAPRSEAALSSLVVGDAPAGGTRVTCTRLDTYWGARASPALVKVDVEGAELLVLRGAGGLMSRPDAPAWVFEWAPHNYRAFGYEPAEVLQAFAARGYSVCRYAGGSLVPVEWGRLPDDTLNLVAVRDVPPARARLGDS